MKIATAFIPSVSFAGAVVGALAIANCHAPAVVQVPAAPVAATVPTPAPPAIPAIDLRAELQAIGNAHVAMPITPSGQIPSATPCARATDADLVALEARIGHWLDARYPAEQEHPDYPIVMTTGCMHADRSIVVDIKADRATRGTNPKGTGRRSFVLRIAPATIVALAEGEGESTDTAMEWSDEGFVYASVLADLDGDGGEDVVVAHVEHEGGAIRSEVTIETVLATGTRATMLGTVDSVEPIVAGDRLVLALFRTPDYITYTCLATTGAVAHCAAEIEASRLRAADEIASRYAGGGAPLPDHDTLVDELTMLQVPPAEIARLAPAARPPTNIETAERRVRAFVDTIDPIDALLELTSPSSRAHPWSAAFEARVHDAFGDVACTPRAQGTKPDPRAFAWARKHGAAADAIVTTPACGTYTWVAWLDAAGDRHFVLLGKAYTPVLERKTPDVNGPPGDSRGALDSSWVVHDGTIVGLILDDDRTAIAIANDTIVGTKPEASRYFYSTRWGDTVDDLVVSGDTWHVTPAGFVSATLPMIAERDAARDAYNTLAGFSADTMQLHDAYVAALITLHADPALVEQVRLLPAR